MINQKTNILRPAHPILHDDHEQMADLDERLTADIYTNTFIYKK